MSETVRLVVFRLDEQRYALPLAAVQRVVRAVEVTFLPNAPSIVLGVIDVGGHVVPALNLRRRFGLAEREVRLGDHFLIGWAAQRAVALLIDEAQEVVERLTTEFIGAAQIVPGLEHIQGVISLGDGLVLIHDLEKFLSLDEGRALDEAMGQELSDGA
jgi:purine-binding chemotaxis protein CheW